MLILTNLNKMIIMKNLLKCFRYSLVMTSLLIVSGCGEKQPEVNWQQEIQKRFDILNQMAGGVECIALKGIEDFPYRERVEYISDHARSTLESLINIDLLSNKLEDEPNPYNKVTTIKVSQYDLTDLGRQYFKKWSQLRYSGFCFGKIMVTDIVSVSRSQLQEYVINYNYTVEHVPNGIEALLTSNYSYIKPEVKNRSITFSFDDNERLYSRLDSSLIVHKPLGDDK